MASDRIVRYKDTVDDVVFAIDSVKFDSLHESLKRHVMKSLMSVHDQNLNFMTPDEVSHQPSKVPKSAPVGGFSSPRPFTKRSGLNSSSPPKQPAAPLKFDVGIFPSDDFRYSADTSSLPACYRVEQSSTPAPAPRIVNCPSVSTPINVLIGNLAVLRQNTSAHNFVAATGLYSSQTPTQSFFTYFHGSAAVDQYYQFVRNGYQ